MLGKQAKVKTLTLEDRAAATEDLRLLELLVKSKTPHAKILASLVFGRLEAVLLGEGLGPVMSAAELLRFYCSVSGGKSFDSKGG